MPCKDVISSVKMLSESRSDPDVGDVIYYHHHANKMQKIIIKEKLILVFVSILNSII